MLLGVFDRLILLNVLPREGDITTIRIVHKLRQDLSFTEEEHAALELHQGDGGAVLWKTDADVPKDVEIGPKAHLIIADAFKKLSESGQLGEQHLSLYDRFVETAT